MDSITPDMFEPISINGRFIYGYLCVRNAIAAKGLSLLPSTLDQLFHDFVLLTSLDEWQSKVDEILPSYLLDDERVKQMGYFEAAETEKIRTYYINQPAFLTELIDELLWIGLANLYGGYNSKFTMGYLKRILLIMTNNSIPLPYFDLIKHCLVSKDKGWGEKDNLQHYYI